MHALTGDQMTQAQTTRYCDCPHGVVTPSDGPPEPNAVPHADNCMFWDEQTDADRMVREQVTSLTNKAGDHQAQAEHWHSKGAHTLATSHGAKASAYRRAANALRDAHMAMLHTHAALSVL